MIPGYDQWEGDCYPLLHGTPLSQCKKMLHDEIKSGQVFDADLVRLLGFAIVSVQNVAVGFMEITFFFPFFSWGWMARFSFSFAIYFPFLPLSPWACLQADSWRCDRGNS